MEIELRQDEANLINRECGSGLSAGVQLLDGREALTYARIRKLDADSDFSRTNRQRKVLDSLIQKFRGSSLSTMLALLNEVLPMITTDMTHKQITHYVLALFPLLMECEISSQRFPIDGGHTMTRINEMSVLVPDLAKNVAFLEETLLK